MPTTEPGLWGGRCVVLDRKCALLTFCLLLSGMLCCDDYGAHTIPFCDQYSAVYLPYSHFVGISVTWLITVGSGGGAKLTLCITNFILRRSQVRKSPKIGLSQSLIFIHPFLPLSPCFILSTPLQLISQKKLFLGIKKMWEGDSPLPCCRPKSRLCL